MARAGALKVDIRSILSAPLEKQDDSVFLHINDEQVTRVNIIATVINHLGENNIMIIDDGTGQVTIQWFDGSYPVSAGDTVLVIGRVRMFSERYIFPEVIKKISDPRWVSVRKKELSELPKVVPTPQQTEKSPEKDVLHIIDENDTGEGADIDKVITVIGNNGEEIIKKLLMAGEIFECKPGKIRLL